MADTAESYSSTPVLAKRRIGGEKPPGPPLQPPSGGGTYDGMDGWQTSVEARLGEIKTDIRDLRTGVGEVKVGLATLTERVAHLPTKGFIIAALLGSLAVMTALVAFQGQIQAFLKITH